MVRQARSGPGWLGSPQAGAICKGGGGRSDSSAPKNGVRAAGLLSDSIDGRWPLKLPITLLLHNEARRMGMAGLWRHRGSRLADRASSPSEKRPCWGWVSRFHAIRPAWADFERGGAGPAESVSSRSRPIVFMGAMQCRAHFFSAIRAIIFCF